MAVWRLRNGPENLHSKPRGREEEKNKRFRASREKCTSNDSTFITGLNRGRGVHKDQDYSLARQRQGGKISALLYSANVTVDTTEDLPTPVVCDESN